MINTTLCLLFVYFCLTSPLCTASMHIINKTWLAVYNLCISKNKNDNDDDDGSTIATMSNIWSKGYEFHSRSGCY